MKKDMILTLNNKISAFARLGRFFGKYTPAISSYLLAALFLYAAYNKLIIYKTFVQQLKSSPLIKELYIPVNVLGLTLSAIALLMTIYKRTRNTGIWFSFALMLAYTLHNYVVAPFSYPIFLSWFVPGIEILIAAALLIPRTRQIGLWSSFYLMALFTVYVFVMPHFFKGQFCSCGGIISLLSWKGHFYMNLSFTMLAGLSLSLLTPKLRSKA